MFVGVDDAALASASNPADTVIVKGKEADVDAAIAALLALIPETEEYPFPGEYHGNLIGPKVPLSDCACLTACIAQHAHVYPCTG